MDKAFPVLGLAVLGDADGVLKPSVMAFKRCVISISGVLSVIFPKSRVHPFCSCSHLSALTLLSSVL